jgi:hypothetical protein
MCANLEMLRSRDPVEKILYQAVIDFNNSVAFGTDEMMVPAIFKQDKPSRSGPLIYRTNVPQITQQVQGSVDCHTADGIISLANKQRQLIGANMPAAFNQRFKDNPPARSHPVPAFSKGLT